MKKIIASCTFIALALGLFSQEKQCVPAFSKNLVQTTHLLKQSMQQKSDTIYWSEDFDGANWSGTVDEDEHNGYEYNGSALPEGWIVYDGSGNDYYWHWSDVGPRGTWTSSNGAWAPRQDLVNNLPGSSENGFMILESDFYNTTASGEMTSNLKDMDSWIQCGPIDLSDAEHVLLEFNQMFRYCCHSTNTLDVFISNDYDTENSASGTWVKFNTKSEVKPNDYTYEEARNISINISEVAGNQSSVYIRWYHTGAWNTHYFWMIDDVVIKRPPDYELLVRDGWADYIDTMPIPADSEDASYLFYGGYTNIPKGLVGTFQQFRAAIENFGVLEQSASYQVDIEKNDSIVYQKTSASKKLSTTQVDTFYVKPSFSPQDTGEYHIKGNLNYQFGDNNLLNNQWNYSFNVSENRYSRVYEANEDTFEEVGSTDWAQGGYDGDAVAQRFVIPKGKGYTKLAGARVYIASHRNEPEALEAIKNNKYFMIARLLPAGDNLWSPSPSNNYLAESDYKFLEISDTSQWIYLPFIDEGNLVVEDDSEYWVSIELYNGNSGSEVQRLDFLVGADNRKGAKQPFNGGACYTSMDNSWFPSDDNYAIDLFLNEMPADPRVTLRFNVNMGNAENFDPYTDVVYVTGTFTGGEGGWHVPGSDNSLRLTRVGSDTYSGAIKIDPNTSVKYLYFINSGWEGAEDLSENRELYLESRDYETYDVFGSLDAGPRITSFKVPHQVGAEVIEIRQDTGHVTVYVETGTDVSWLTPTITTPPEYKITPASGIPQDFSHKVWYYVSGYNSLVGGDWIVTVEEAPPHSASIKSIYVNDVAIPDFSPDSMDYTYWLTGTPQQVPSVSAQAYHQNTTVEITQAQNTNGSLQERTASIKTFAANDSSSLTYHVTFEICSSDTTYIEAGLCKGEYYTFHNQFLDSPGTYYKTLVSDKGCDSIIALTLIAVEPVSDSISDTVCQGEVYLFGNQQLANTGKYSETFESAMGCDSVVTLYLEVTEVETGIIKEGSTLTAKAQNAEYQWLDCNNSHLAIPNETNAEFTAPATSYYALQVSQNNCVDTSECINVFGLGIKDNNINPLLEIYPNPSSNELNISHLGGEKITSIVIYNMHGKKVLEKSIKWQNSLNINIAPLEKGLYAIKVSTTNKQFIQTFIKQ